MSWNKNNSSIPPFPRKYVYFEKQSNDRLCGMHCLNSLLQAPYFDPVTLSEIGLNLDKMESNLLGKEIEGTNVDDDGNYGIQVLTEALRMYDCQVRPLKKREAITMVEGTQKVEALIFNSSTHWYAIRKIDGIWFNLNSTNALPGPEIISDFYLSAFIQGAEDIGYTNFLVMNLPRLPDIHSDVYSNLQSNQRLVPIEDIIKVRESKKADKKKEEEKAEDANKFKAFQGKGVTIDSYSHNPMQEFEDDEMRQAYELSLLEYSERLKRSLPIEPKVGMNITVKYNSQEFKRRFKETDTIQNVVDFVKSEIPTLQDIELYEPFPRQVYYNTSQTLKQAGFSMYQILYAKLA